MQIILASASPRRRELLAMLGFPFSVEIPRVPEIISPGEDPADFCRRLSQDKARAIAAGAPGALVIAADTIVVLEGTIMGKPHDRAEAATFLRRLSDHEHEVLTAYTIWHNGAEHTRVVRTDVHFRALTEDDITWYLNSGEPFDKAGAYAIQGLGGVFIDRISGSHTNVIGLPLAEVALDLEACGFRLAPDMELQEGS